MQPKWCHKLNRTGATFMEKQRRICAHMCEAEGECNFSEVEQDENGIWCVYCTHPFCERKEVGKVKAFEACYAPDSCPILENCKQRGVEKLKKLIKKLNAVSPIEFRGIFWKIREEVQKKFGKSTEKQLPMIKSEKEIKKMRNRQNRIQLIMHNIKHSNITGKMPCTFLREGSKSVRASKHKSSWSRNTGKRQRSVYCQF